MISPHIEHVDVLEMIAESGVIETVGVKSAICE